MTIKLTSDVFCDIGGRRCEYWIHGTVSTKPRKAKARTRARAAGWGYVYDNETSMWIDVCPHCLKDLQGEK